jgi:hypothetical protein
MTNLLRPLLVALLFSSVCVSADTPSKGQLSDFSSTIAFFDKLATLIDTYINSISRDQAISSLKDVDKSLNKLEDKKSAIVTFLDVDCAGLDTITGQKQKELMDKVRGARELTMNVRKEFDKFVQLLPDKFRGDGQNVSNQLQEYADGKIKSLTDMTNATRSPAGEVDAKKAKALANESLKDVKNMRTATNNFISKLAGS